MSTKLYLRDEIAITFATDISALKINAKVSGTAHDPTVYTGFTPVKNKSQFTHNSVLIRSNEFSRDTIWDALVYLEIGIVCITLALIMLRVTHVLPVERTDDKNHQLKDTEHQAIFRRRCAFLLRLREERKLAFM